MRTETIKIYKYDELPTDKAKEKARNWWRKFLYTDSSDWQNIYDEAKHIGSLFGLEIGKIYFSGFWSQGDGASFDGEYKFKKGAVKAIEDYTSSEELSRIVRALYRVQRLYSYKLEATCKTKGHYCNSSSMQVDVWSLSYYDTDLSDAEDDIKSLLRGFADWIYKQLKDDYEYQSNVENVEEAIRANEYEFYENGDKA